ncbi:MAG: protein kinase [Isosphaeraceae bacterium]
MSTPSADPPRTCPDQPTLLRWIRDQLAEEDAAAIDEHVDLCSSCRQAVERLDSELGRGGLLLSVTPPLVDDDEPPPLEGYEHLGRISAGGMGVVWRFHDLKCGRDLAVKVMKSKFRASPEALRRFFEEARVIGQLTHPLIVPIHTMGRLPDGRGYYTMKLVEGETLASLLRGRSDLADRRDEFVRIFHQVCQALAYAHGRGVIHRDLKPTNVMVGKHGEVQVMDWGLSKDLTAAPPGTPPEAHADGSGSGSSDHTGAGSVLGTCSYMPPEQACGRVGEVDQRSDVFGLGAILCEILTGEPPYPRGDRSDAELLEAAREARLDHAIGRLRACGAEPDLVRLAEHCLAPERADRPADAAEVAGAVSNYQKAVEVRLQQERLERERQQVKTAEEARRRRLWAGLSASLLATAVVLAAGLLAANHFRVEADRNSQTARQQAEIAIDTLQFLTGEVNAKLEVLPEADPLRRELMQETLRRVERIDATLAGPEAVGLTTMLAARTMGDLSMNMIDISPQAADARTALGRAADEYGRAVRVARELAAERPDELVMQVDLAQALVKLATCQRRSSSEEARATLDEADRYTRECLVSHPGSKELRLARVECLYELGDLWWRQLREMPKSFRYFEEGEKIARALSAEHPDDAGCRSVLCTAILGSSSHAVEAKDYPKALKYDRERLEISERWFQQSTDPLESQRARLDLAFARLRLGQTLCRALLFDKAVKPLSDSIQEFEGYLQRAPLHRRARVNLYFAYRNLGEAYQGLKDAKSAEGAFRKALAEAEKLADAVKDDLQYETYLSLGLERLAMHLLGESENFSNPEAMALLERKRTLDGTIVARDPKIVKSRRDYSIAHELLGVALVARPPRSIPPAPARNADDPRGPHHRKTRRRRDPRRLSGGPVLCRALRTRRAKPQRKGRLHGAGAALCGTYARLWLGSAEPACRTRRPWTDR